MKNLGKRIIMVSLTAGIVLCAIFGLYQINAQIPSGVLVSGIPEKEIKEAYQDLYVEISAYNGEGNFTLLTPQPQTEQILTFTLQKRYPDAYVRDLGTERKIRFAAILLFLCIAVFLFLNPLIFYLMGEKGKNFRFLVRIGEVFLLCFLVRGKGVLPSVCIPEKFIYLGEWWGKCREYLDGIKKLGEIPCSAYQKYAAAQMGLFLLAVAGIIVFLVFEKSQKDRFTGFFCDLTGERKKKESK